MQFVPFRKPDGTEELRFKPETPEDCDSIECSKCYFQNSEEPFKSYLEDMKELDGTIFNPSRSAKKAFDPSFPSFPTSLEDLMRRSTENRKVGVGSQMTLMALPFKIVDGKIVTNPETKKIMEDLGIIEELEKMIREEEDGN